MNSKQIAILLLAAAPAFAAKYDPDRDRAALRGAANASYNACVRAAGLPLEPQKAADIKASLDECLDQARAAASAAKSLEDGAGRRSSGMDGVLKGHGAPAPDAAAKDLTDAAAAQRARWKSLSSDHDDLKRRVDALPEKNPDGAPNGDKPRLGAALGRAAGSLSDAERALGRAETGASAATGASGDMAQDRKRSLAPDGERAANDGEVVRLADDMLQPVADAKYAVDQIGVEPQSVNRTRAVDKLDVPRTLARRLDAAADRACNRADDYHNLSSAFDRALADFTSSSADAAAATAAAKASLDEAARTQADVQARLDRPKP
jgi:hypothetical protein